jgi:hypothetical protein
VEHRFASSFVGRKLSGYELPAIQSSKTLAVSLADEEYVINQEMEEKENIIVHNTKFYEDLKVSKSKP